MKKTLKRRTFISAIAMLIVSAIVLTSSTFAWFSMARQVGVEQMELTVTSPEGIQISANPNAWTTQLHYSDLFPTNDTVSRFKADTDNTNYAPELLNPVSSILDITADTKRQLPVFYYGRVDEEGKLTTTKLETDKDAGYMVFDVYLKVSETQVVYWDKTTVTEVENGNEEVVYATRVALVNCGTASASAPSDAKNLLPKSNSATQLLEPVAYTHLSELVSANKIQNGTTKTTNYIQKEFSDYDVTNQGFVYPSNNEYASSTRAAFTANEQDNRARMNMTLNPGITRIRVYLWMEGNDIDCLQSVGGSQFDFNLVFSLDNK